MPETILSPYVRARAEEAEKKRKIAAPIIAANATLTPLEVAARVNAELQRRGFSSPLNGEDIREMRHAARKAKGLPFDGIANRPDRSPEAVRARHQQAIEFAAKRLEKGQATTISEVQRASGIGYDQARICLHTATQRIRRARRMEATVRDTTPPVPAPGAPPQTVTTYRLNGETKAALSLLTEAMDGEGIITIHVSKGEGGRWGYTCTRRVTEDLTGAL